MNVLCITEYFPHKRNLYAGVAVQSLCHALTSFVNVDIVNFFPLFPTFKKWSVSYLHRKYAPEYEKIQGLSIIRPGYWNIPKIGKLFAPDLFVKNLLKNKFLQMSNYDLIHANWIFRAGYVGKLLSRQLHIPYIITCHGSDVHIDLYKRGLTGRLSHEALVDCDHIITVSQELRNCVQQASITQEKITIIPNGVDLNRFYPQVKEEARKNLRLPVEKFIFTYIGNFFHIKGPDILLKSVTRLRTINNNFLVLLVGQGSMQEEMTQFIQESKIESIIKFIPPQEHSDISQWLAASDALVLPSRNEGCPMIVLESLASGRPVIGARVGAVPELISDDTIGKVVPPENPEVFAQGMAWAMNQEWVPETISNRVKKWGWENRARQVFELYEKILKERKNF